ncbi:hypothetical protein [Clostridium sp. HBUAS56010]|uniref:hypothetical protein n=1 Tax=Clostridium sp. HBUAS56010 TaxID=2571127 RepID=UPI0011774BF8|nr:hypothetical protein [Clostridium sp. HBUAS56010]
MYTLTDFIKDFDNDNKVKKSISNCITQNMNKDIALEVLSQDLEEKLYEWIEYNDDLDIDDGSNVRRDFKKAIVDILSEYFEL